ncbi:AraC family transcriptional regulator [Celeribacter baekdonensis]|uniref:HTH araC/xylS-type domain-containing protein n=1 Tax=Celeribacter baekdonensis TaxID=875171 RepID=A0A2R4LY71_9RHOB|nr:AraC family transcriptional regulator [Celeribacter baekdonensis]AVW89845.1 hypothetical protein DA792_01265 [Celeribacter baekdonensis]
MTRFDGQPATEGLPLGAHPLFSSDDLDETRDCVARVYCDHRLETIGSGHLAARHNRLAGRSLSINVMTYGAKTLIAPGELERFYLFQFPIRGSASVANGSNQHEIGGGFGGVLNPDAPTCMIWSEGCVQVLVQIEKAALLDAARAEFGLPSGQTLHFDGANDMRGGEGRAFMSVLDFVMREAEQGTNLVDGDTLLARQLERTLMIGVLQTQTHNLDPVMRGASGPVPRILRRAEEFMRENLQNPIMIEDIAQAAGTSVRTLQSMCRARYGRAPMTVLRDLRLDQAWEDLSNPKPDTSVTTVAMALGFFHLGRFSEHYRGKFGCTPIETLRAAKRP